MKQRAPHAEAMGIAYLPVRPAPRKVFACQPKAPKLEGGVVAKSSPARRPKFLNGTDLRANHAWGFWMAQCGSSLPAQRARAIASTAVQDLCAQSSPCSLRTHSLGPMSAGVALCSRGVFDRFPKLRVGLLEANCSWAPWLLGRLDDHYLDYTTSASHLLDAGARQLVVRHPAAPPRDDLGTGRGGAPLCPWLFVSFQLVCAKFAANRRL